MRTVEVRNVYKDVESKQGVKYKSPRYTLVTEDNKGKLVDVELVENGNFTNIESVSPHTENGGTLAPMRQRDPSDSRLIVRQVALKCAVELAAAGKIPMDSVKAYADKCVMWIYEQSTVTRMTSDGEEV